MGKRSLTAKEVEKLAARGRHAVGPGNLYLQISSFDTKSWVLRYMVDGKARMMGLGSIDRFTLKEARERAREARQLISDGIDPIDVRREQRARRRAEAARRITFDEAAEKYIAAHRPAWKNRKHADQWESTLESYASPVIGGLDVADVDTAHIMKILEPIWTSKTETASRLRGRVELVIDWSTARGFRSGENPARWRGHLDKLLPPPSKVQRIRHHPAMAYSDVPKFIVKLRDREGIGALALEFTILTAVRTSETIGARWSEIDLAKKVWAIPAERMKAAHAHRVPLCDRAIEILNSLPREASADPFIFPGMRKGRALSNMAMLNLVKTMTDNAYTVHGFRSSFRDWAGEETNFPREICEAALAHKIKDKAEAAYRRGDALERRRKLMEAWSNYIDRPREPGKVLSLHKGRADDRR